MNFTVDDLALALSHVGFWLPLTVAVCVIAVWAMRSRRKPS